MFKPLLGTLTILFSILPLTAHAGQSRPQILSSCGEALSAFHREDIAMMSEDEANSLLKIAYPELSLISPRQIDEEIGLVVEALSRIEDRMELEKLKADRPQEIDKLRAMHQDLAITLVALKRRRAKVFRPIEN